MTNSPSLRWAQVLGLVGAAASVATIYAAPAMGLPKLSCLTPALDCGVALESPFSKIAGIPLGVFGMFYFVFWSLNLHAYRRTGDAVYQWSFSWITILGALVSISLAGVMFLVLHAPCLFCLIIHGVNITSVALLWPAMQFRPTGRPSRDNLWHFVTLSAVSLLAAATLALAAENRNLQAVIHDLQPSGSR